MSSAADPAIGATPATPGVDISAFACRGLYVGTTGDVSVLMSAGGTATFVGVQGGTVLPVRVKQVNVAGTTASNILALY